jgi:hypothetical protein
MTADGAARRPNPLPYQSGRRPATRRLRSLRLHSTQIFIAPPRWSAVSFFNKADSAAGKRFIHKPLELPMQQKILMRNHEYLAGFANVKGEDHEYECQ